MILSWLKNRLNFYWEPQFEKITYECKKPYIYNFCHIVHLYATYNNLKSGIQMHYMVQILDVVGLTLKYYSPKNYEALSEKSQLE